DEQFALIADNPTWSAAVAHPKFLGGRLLFNRAGARGSLMTRHDRDADGMVARAELRSALLNDSAGDALRLAQGEDEATENEELLALIDVDGDWRLSVDEIRQAAAHVATADFTQDGALLPFELQRAVPRSRLSTRSLAVLLGRQDSAGTALSLL